MRNAFSEWYVPDPQFPATELLTWLTAAVLYAGR
jgi:hypothetical protein